MIEVKQFVDIIENQLNALAVGKDFTFKIYPNEGEFVDVIQSSQTELPKDVIYGVVTFLPNTTIPLANLGIFNITASLSILAPVTRGALSNDDTYGHVNEIADILQNYYQQQTGASGTLTDKSNTAYKYVLGINTPQTGQESVYGKAGRAVPLSMVLSWQLIRGGVLFTDVHVLIDGTEVVCTDFGAELNVGQQTDNIQNQAYLQSYPQSQNLSMTVQLPYQNTALCKKLIAQLWNGTLQQSFTVKYYDGTTYTEETAITKKMIASRIITNAQPGTNMGIVATFTLSR